MTSKELSLDLSSETDIGVNIAIAFKYIFSNDLHYCNVIEGKNMYLM